jgi:DNA polymerase-1
MENLVLIKSKKDLDNFLSDYLPKFDLYAVDTEATGLDESDDIIGISVCAESDRAFYVIIKAWNNEKQQLDDILSVEDVRPLVETLSKKSLIMHNSLFDCKLIKRCIGVDLMPSIKVDTLILSHLLDENRSNRLKDLGALYFGDDAKKEQQDLATSVQKNGGLAKINKKSFNIEMYKADSDIIGKYGAKDALLTFNLAILLIEQLAEDQNLWKFFFDDESMPLLKGPTYQMNTMGLKVDVHKLDKLEADLRFEILKLEESIYSDIYPYVKDEYPGTNKKNKFNINSPSQFSWLLFVKLGQEYKKLTPAGRALAKQLVGRIPYTISAKKQFIKAVQDSGKKPEKFIAADKAAISQLKDKYKWLENFITYKRLDKLQKTYVQGIKERIRYGIIHPSFLQHGTTSGRYSSKDPNFQNLPRDDKRIKECIIARPGKVFVGADYSQLEPRVFAYYSQDVALMRCFEEGTDFYSIIGAKVYRKEAASLKKDDEGSFAKLYKNLRQNAKTISLSATYGTTAYKMVDSITTEDGRRMTVEECQYIIDTYFDEFPGVKLFMDRSHKEVVETGLVSNLYGRPRRIPEAKALQKYGKFSHHNLEYSLRNLLNLSVNHKIQSTGASIINRSAIALCSRLQKEFKSANLVLQVHDSLVVECDEKDAQKVSQVMKECMETTCSLNGVKLEAEPQIGKNLSEV